MGNLPGLAVDVVALKRLPLVTVCTGMISGLSLYNVYPLEMVRSATAASAGERRILFR
jgi:hypothetical protein